MRNRGMGKLINEQLNNEQLFPIGFATGNTLKNPRWLARTLALQESSDSLREVG